MAGLGNIIDVFKSLVRMYHPQIEIVGHFNNLIGTAKLDFETKKLDYCVVDWCTANWDGIVGATLTTSR